MKRMLFICAALLAASIASAVESANIVGYLKTTATGQFFTTGPTFVECQSFLNTETTPQWRLGDVKLEGANDYSDTISFLDPITGSAGDLLIYSADGWGNPDWIGWWDKDTQEVPYNDEMFDISEGFLCNFSSPNIVLTYAGEVITQPMTVDLSGMQFPVIANFVPKTDMTLGDIALIGANDYSDTISILDPATGSAGDLLIYSADGWGNPDWIGWWDKDTQEVPYNDEPLPAGVAFLANFSSPNVKVSFPSPLE